MQPDYNSAALALTGLQNYWPLTDGAVSSFADSKGSKTLTSASALGTTTGPDGTATAAAFAATDNRVLTASSVTMPESHTVAYWMKLNATPGSDAMSFEWNQLSFSKYVQHVIGYTGGITGYTTGARSIFATYYGTATGSNASHVDETSFGTGTWKFVVVTFDATQGSGTCMKVYIDGTLSSIVTGLTNYDQPDGAPGTGYLGVGGRNNAGTRAVALDGSLCGVILMSGVMSGSDMTALKNAMLVVGKSASDSATATDASAVASLSSLSASDSGTATDTAVVNVLALTSASDSASATDSGSSAVAVQVTSGGATVADDFTGTNGTALTSHTPSGTNHATGPWVTHPGSGISPVIDTNRAVGQSGGTAMANLTDAPGTADYDVTADVTILSALPSLFGGVQGRFNLSTLDGYTALADPNTGNVYLYAYSGGNVVGGTYLASYAAGFTSGTRTITLRMVGTSIKVLLNGTVVISVTDSNVTAAGHAGIRASGSTTTGVAVDNLTVTTATTYSAVTDSATATESATPTTAPTAVSASDSVAATDTAGRTDTALPVSASDSVGATDTAGLLAYRPLVTYGTLTAVPGPTGSRSAITATTDDFSHQWNGVVGSDRNPNTGTVIVGMQHSYTETFNPAYGGNPGDGYNSIRIKRSTDGGATFTTITDLTNGDFAGSDTTVNFYDRWYDTPVAGGSPAVLTNVWVVKFCYITPVLSGESAMVVYNGYAISTNDGLTWSGIRDFTTRIGFAQPGRYAANPAGLYELSSTPVVELADGTHIATTYLRTTNNWGDWDFYSRAYRSTDYGQTWSGPYTIAPHVISKRSEEPFVVELANGRLLCALRVSENASDYNHPSTTDTYSIWMSHSDDQGVTWATPTKVLGQGAQGASGYPSATWGLANRPDMTVTPEGAILLFNRSMYWTGSAWASSTPVYAASTDGYTWTDLRKVSDGTTWNPTVRGFCSMHGNWIVTGAANATNNLRCFYAEYGTVPPTDKCQIYTQVWTTAAVTGGAGSLGAETATATDAGSVTVGVGAIAKTATDSATTTDTGNRSAVTRYITAIDSAVVLDSSGTDTNVKLPVRILRDTYVTSEQFGSKTVSSATFGDRTTYVHPESEIKFA